MPLIAAALRIRRGDHELPGSISSQTASACGAAELFERCCRLATADGVCPPCGWPEPLRVRRGRAIGRNVTGEGRAVGGVDVHAPRLPDCGPLACEARVRRERTPGVEPDDRKRLRIRRRRRAVRVADVEADLARPVRVVLDEMGQIERRRTIRRYTQSGPDQQHLCRIECVGRSNLPERDVVAESDSAQRVSRSNDVGSVPAASLGSGRGHPEHQSDQERLSPIEPVRVGKSAQRDVVVLCDRRKRVSRSNGITPAPGRSPRRCSPSRSKQYHQHSDEDLAAHPGGFATCHLYSFPAPGLGRSASLRSRSRAGGRR